MLDIISPTMSLIAIHILLYGGLHFAKSIHIHTHILPIFLTTESTLEMGIEIVIHLPLALRPK